YDSVGEQRRASSFFLFLLLAVPGLNIDDVINLVLVQQFVKYPITEASGTSPFSEVRFGYVARITAPVIPDARVMLTPVAEQLAAYLIFRLGSWRERTYLLNS